MCDFLSWIEVKDKAGNPILCYLTDQDVFSDFGRKALKDCKDNDVLGHGAIRKFFKITNGRDFEQNNFWETENLPEELAQKVKDFDQHWGRIFKKGAFQNDDLCYMIINAPEPFKKKAWQQLLMQKPDIDDLRFMVRLAPEPFNKKAWQRLLMQKPDNDDLRYIIQYASEPFTSQAIKILNSSS